MATEHQTYIIVVKRLTYIAFDATEFSYVAATIHLNFEFDCSPSRWHVLKLASFIILHCNKNGMPLYNNFLWLMQHLKQCLLFHCIDGWGMWHISITYLNHTGIQTYTDHYILSTARQSVCATATVRKLWFLSFTYCRLSSSLTKGGRWLWTPTQPKWCISQAHVCKPSRCRKT